MEAMSLVRQYGEACTTKSKMRSRISSTFRNPTTHLRVKCFMLPGHEQDTSDFPGHLGLPGGEIAVQFEQALTDPRLEIENS